MKNIFKKTFENFEPQPPRRVWENIEKSIKKSSNFSTLKKGMISTASAILVVSTIIFFQYRRNNLSNLEKATTPQQIINNEIINNNKNLEENYKQEIVISHHRKLINANKNNENNKPVEDSKIKEIVQNVSEKLTDSHNQVKNNTTINENKENYNNTPIVIKSTDQYVHKEQINETKFSISGEQTICRGEKAILSVEGGVRYLWSTGERSKSIIVNPNITTDYSVMITDENGNNKTGLVTVTVADCFALLVPNAFTPNGDGQHDIFKPIGNNIRKFEMTILSRTGQIVFISQSINDGWDGTIGGKPAPTGVYVYNITYINEINQNKILQGSVTLIR